MGYSRDTFYRDQQAVEEGGVEALLEKSRGKRKLRNRNGAGDRRSERRPRVRAAGVLPGNE